MMRLFWDAKSSLNYLKSTKMKLEDAARFALWKFTREFLNIWRIICRELSSCWTATYGSRKVRRFVFRDTRCADMRLADITALLRNNSRTRGVFSASDRKMSRTSLPRCRFSSLKSVLVNQHNVLLAQFINGRIHRPPRYTRQARKVVRSSKVSLLASLGDAIISRSSLS